MTGTMTIGALAAALLALAAEAAQRGILGMATRRAYVNLKEKLAQLGQEAATSEFSTAWRLRLAPDPVERSAPVEKENIKALALALLEALKNDVRRGSLGVSLQRLDAIRLQLEMARA